MSDHANLNKTLPLPAYLAENDVLAALILAARDCAGVAGDTAIPAFIAAAEQELIDRGDKPPKKPAKPRAKRGKMHTVAVVARFDAPMSASDAAFAVWNAIGGLEMYGNGKLKKGEERYYRDNFDHGFLRVPGFRNPKF